MSQTIAEINSNNVLNFLNNGFSTNGDSQSKVIQVGNANTVELFLINDVISSVQIGNANSSFYQNDNPRINTEMKLTAIGNNNDISVIGSNSISNGMTVEVIGNNKTVFIENR